VHGPAFVGDGPATPQRHAWIVETGKGTGTRTYPPLVGPRTALVVVCSRCMPPWMELEERRGDDRVQRCMLSEAYAASIVVRSGLVTTRQIKRVQRKHPNKTPVALRAGCSAVLEIVREEVHCTYVSILDVFLLYFFQGLIWFDCRSIIPMVIGEFVILLCVRCSSHELNIFESLSCLRLPHLHGLYDPTGGLRMIDPI
jgi:hypothetical protein